MQREIRIDDPDADYQVLEVDFETDPAVSCLLTLRWAGDGKETTRAGWFFDLQLAGGTDVLMGRRVKLGDLFSEVHGISNVPAVRLLVVDTSGSDVEPVRGELGRRVLLVWDSELDA